MALPLLIGIGGVYAYKKIRDKEYEELRKKYELDKPRDLDIGSILFFVSSLYSVANADGEIDKREEKFIEEEIENILENIEDNSKKESLTYELKEIEKNKHTIKLSKALEYITPDNEENIKKDLEMYKELVKKLAYADTKLLKTEEEILKRIDIICNKGKKSIDEIKQLEERDIVPENYYLTSKRDTEKLTPITKVITKRNKSFNNLDELQSDKYYVKHPMDSKKLFNIEELSKIDELQVCELQEIVKLLGAKKFSCIIEIETENNTNINKDADWSIKEKTASFFTGLTSSKKDYEKKFTKLNWESLENDFCEDKNSLIKNLLWLKNDPHVKSLIKQRIPGKSEKVEYTLSLNKFVNESTGFDISSHLSLLGKINPNLGVTAKKNIEMSLNYKLNFTIEF